MFMHRYTPAPYKGRGYCNSGELGTPKGWIIKSIEKKTRPPTQAGWRMLQAVPPEGIDETSLIRKLDGFSSTESYANYKRGIEELVRTGYLIREDGKYKHVE